MLPAESIGPKKIKNTHKLDTQLVQSIALFTLSPTKQSVFSMPLSGFTEMSQGLSPVVPHGASGSLLPIYAVLSVAKLRAWLYHSTGPFRCNCFLTSSASLYTFLLKHPFKTVITLPGNPTASLLISGVFSCHYLPCHFKVNAP